MKGTSTTEYLIVLGVILVIAIIASSLLGLFPAWGGAAGEDASRAKWASQTPFSVIDSKPGPAKLDVVVSNSGGTQAKLRKVVVKPIGSTEKFATDENLVFEAGQRAVIGVDVPEGMPEGTRYGMEFCYSTASGMDTCSGDYDTPIPCTGCETPVCKTADEACGNGADCCSSQCTGGSCCIQNGQLCSNGGCCDGACIPRPDGYGDTCCNGVSGAQCISDPDCCPTGSTSSSMACGGTNPDGSKFCCLADGSDGCSADGAICCSGICTNDICQAPPTQCGNNICESGENYATCPGDCPCLGAGSQATDPAQCCPTAPLHAGFCRKDSGSCSSPNECLSNRCVDGQCATDCGGPLGYCTKDSDCCTGSLCNVPTNTCIPCITQGDECPQEGRTCCGGLSCQFGTPYTCQPECQQEGNSCNPSANNCCSGLVCNPDGGGSYVCGAEPYCISFGQSKCSQPTDCCGSQGMRGTCNDGTCGMCQVGVGSCIPGGYGGVDCCSGTYCSGAYHGCNICLGLGDTCSGAQNGPCCGSMTCKNGVCTGTPPSCVGEGNLCGEYSHTTCCSEFACGPENVCVRCIQNGNQCDEDHPCCSGLLCSNGACTACAGAGQSCDKSPCCNPTQYVCNMQNTCALCDPIGSYCDSQTPCCSGISCDEQNRCQASCQPPGSPCSDANCCYGSTCDKGTCSSCGGDGASCDASHPCCAPELACNSKGTCSQCHGNGASCDSTTPCCTGFTCGGDNRCHG